MNQQPSSPRRFHGPKILGLTVYSQLIALGCSLYIFGLFIEPISEAFGTSRGSLGWGPSILFIMSAGLAPVLGYLVDKGKIRIMMISGSLLLATGLCLISFATQLWQMALALALLIGMGSGMLGPIPCSALVVHWYQRRRGFALGIATAGSSLGGFLMPPTAAWLISQFGWQQSLVILGCVVAVTVTPAVWFLAVNKPKDIDQYPDGDKAPVEIEANQHTESTKRLTTGELLRDQNFWLIGLAIGLINGTGAFCVTYIVPFTSEMGFGAQLGALLISTFAGCALAGKFLFGTLCDHYNPRNILLLVIGGFMVGWTLLFSLPTKTGLTMAAMIAGLAAGGILPVWNTLVAKVFGQEVFARVLGAMYLLTTPFILSAGPLGGYGFDMFGSYLPILKAAWFIFPITAVLTFFIAPHRAQPTPAPSPAN